MRELTLLDRAHRDVGREGWTLILKIVNWTVCIVLKVGAIAMMIHPAQSTYSSRPSHRSVTAML